MSSTSPTPFQPRPNAPTPEDDGLLLASALVGTLAMEASLISQGLTSLQASLGNLLGQAKLTDKDISDIQSLDELTQRIADLSAILDTAGQSMDARDRLFVSPLLEIAKLAHSRALVAGLDLTRSHEKPLGEHGDPSAADPVTFF